MIRIHTIAVKKKCLYVWLGEDEVTVPGAAIKVRASND